MKCREVRREIALQLGHDSQDRDRWEEARLHLAQCPGCRVHMQRIKTALACVEQANTSGTYETRDSVWPELESRLSGSGRRGANSFRPWMPLVSVAAACLLFVGVWISAPPPGSGIEGPVNGRSMIPVLPEFPAQHSDVRRRAQPPEDERPSDHVDQP